MRIVVALVLLALAGWSMVRMTPSAKRGVGVELLATAPLGRDVVRVVGCGPEVIALLSTRSSTVVIGRWPREEWIAACRSKDVEG